MMKLSLKRKNKKVPITTEERLAAADKRALSLEKVLGEYMTYMSRPWRIVWSNMLAGIARGVGLTLGVAVVIVLTVKILSILISWKFPWLSDVSESILQVIKTTPGLERYTEAISEGIKAHPGK